jgi:hypothetical protein
VSVGCASVCDTSHLAVFLSSISPLSVRLLPQSLCCTRYLLCGLVPSNNSQVDGSCDPPLLHSAITRYLVTVHYRASRRGYFSLDSVDFTILTMNLVRILRTETMNFWINYSYTKPNIRIPFA